MVRKGWARGGLVIGDRMGGIGGLAGWWRTGREEQGLVLRNFRMCSSMYVCIYLAIIPIWGRPRQGNSFKRVALSVRRKKYRGGDS